MSKGYKGNDLKQYIELRIKESIIKTKYYFNYKSCSNCFAKIAKEELEKQTQSR